MIPFDFNGWTCTLTRNGHLFKRGREKILVRHGPNRLLTVQRTWLARTFNLHPPTYGNVNDGGEQGGQGIVLYPTTGSLAQLDGTIERHAIASFMGDGTPRPPWPGPRYPLSQDSESPYKRIDGAHYVRAYSHAVAQFAHDRDPVARMWLILCAHEVMRRFPLAPFTDGEGPEYSLVTMLRNVFATPHTGALGIQRENAWALRCVVEAQRVAPSRMTESWVRQFVEMLYMGQAANGATERHDKASGLQQGEPWGMFGLAENVEVCVSWQIPFMVVAVREAMRVVPETYAHGRVVLARFKEIWRSVPYTTGDVYDGIPTAPGLPRYLVVARDGVLSNYIREGVGPARSAYDGYAFQAFREVGL